MKQRSMAPEVLEQLNTFGVWSFEDIGARYEAACDWLAGMGVKVSPSRIGQYRRDLADLVTYYNATGPEHDTLASRLPDMLVTLFEVTELVTIHGGLCNYADQGSLAARLRRVATGPVWGAVEILNNSSTQARNVAFELLTAARCMAGGYEVDLSTDADVIVSRAGRSIVIECKRPQSAEALKRNLKSALEQLTRRYGASKDPASVRGIVAISINKAVPMANQALTTPNHLTAGIRVQQVVEQFLAEHRHRWTAADPRTIGVLLNFRAITILQEPKMITVANQDGWDSLARDSDDYTQIVGVAETLAQRHSKAHG